MKKTLELIGEYYILMTRVFQKPDKWKIFWKQYAIEAYKLIIDSIPIVTIISVFIGAVIVIQTANNMDNPFIPKMYIGYMAREMLALEFCSTMVALILAGKIGSNIASDAMEMMGVNSANYLILPKIVSATTLSPLLMLLSFMVGLLGGAMIVILTGIVNYSQYVEGLQFAFKPFYIYYSMTKIAVFGFLITSIASFYGYYAKGGSLGVGRSSTKAIVISSGLILVFNLVLTKIML